MSKPLSRLLFLWDARGSPLDKVRRCRYNSDTAIAMHIQKERLSYVRYPEKKIHLCQYFAAAVSAGHLPGHHDGRFHRVCADLSSRTSALSDGYGLHLHAHQHADHISDRSFRLSQADRPAVALTERRQAAVQRDRCRLPAGLWHEHRADPAVQPAVGSIFHPDHR